MLGSQALENKLQVAQNKPNLCNLIGHLLKQIKIYTQMYVFQWRSKSQEIVNFFCFEESLYINFPIYGLMG